MKKKLRIKTGCRAALVRASGLDPNNPNRPGLTSRVQAVTAADLFR